MRLWLSASLFDHALRSHWQFLNVTCDRSIVSSFCCSWVTQSPLNAEQKCHFANGVERSVVLFGAQHVAPVSGARS
jgi:hypothetical protein